MNLQPLIDNFHLWAPTGLFGLGFFVWALHKFVSGRATGNPAYTWEDDWLPWLDATKAAMAQGVEWYADYRASKGDVSWKDGQKKFDALTGKIEEWERLWKGGQKRQVLTDFAAWYFDLQGKSERLNKIPFPSSPKPSTIPSLPAASGAGQDPDAVGNPLADTPADDLGGR